MLKLNMKNRSLLGIALVGAIGFSIYGVVNTVSAFDDSGISLQSDSTGINITGTTNISPDGTICSPYGCEGCSGCVSLEYQQTIEKAPAPTVELINEN